jgi:hypothetical protein
MYALAIWPPLCLLKSSANNGTPLEGRVSTIARTPHYKETPDQAALQAAIARMRQTSLQSTDVQFLAQTIQDGLAPACAETGLHSARNIPLGYIDPGEEASGTEWVHPTVAADEDCFGCCRCCGPNYLYRVEDLDEQMLCQEHKGEFDPDSPEEAQDWEDYIENLTKDL